MDRGGGIKTKESIRSHGEQHQLASSSHSFLSKSSLLKDSQGKQTIRL